MQEEKYTAKIDLSGTTRENLIKLWEEYLEEFAEREREISHKGGHYMKEPNFGHFMEYLKDGYLN